LTALQDQKSKTKTLPIVVDQLNNGIDNSILSGKSDVIECGFAFMGIEYYTVMFMWL
jgi:hypothetical protein